MARLPLSVSMPPASNSPFPRVSHLCRSVLMDAKTVRVRDSKLQVMPSESTSWSSLPLATFLAVGASAVLTFATVQGAAAQEAGLAFQRSCAGCHAGGGNVIQPGATLFSKDLERNGISSLDDIYNMTYSGKGRMPGFGEKCTPRGQCTFGPRLSDQDIRAIAEYVKLQSDNGWSIR